MWKEGKLYRYEKYTAWHPIKQSIDPFVIFGIQQNREKIVTLSRFFKNWWDCDISVKRAQHDLRSTGGFHSKVGQLKEFEKIRESYINSHNLLWICLPFVLPYWRISERMLLLLYFLHIFFQIIPYVFYFQSYITQSLGT